MIDIVVTGIGVISPLGTGREAFWENTKKATTGIKKIRCFETSSFRSNVAGWVDDFDPSCFMAPENYRRMSRVSRMAVASSIEAMQDSGLSMDFVKKDRIGIVMGTSYGSTCCTEDFYMSLLKNGPRGAQPFLFPETVPNAPASHIAMFHGITGPNTTFSQNEISSENAMLYARNLLLHHQADVVLVGGADELSAIQFSCYDALGVLNSLKVENGEPVIPELGGGLILGEGAGVLVMERLDYAMERGAKIYGTLRSGVITGGIVPTGHYETEGEQAARAMFLAIQQADIGANKIDHVNVSANFSRELDRMEYNVLQRIFPNRVNELSVTPLKYLMGDFGGAGIISAATILLALHYRSPLPGVRPEILKGGPERSLEWHTNGTGRFQTALMTTTTFGGGTASLVWIKH